MAKAVTNRVVEIMSGTPAVSAGIHGGDRILSINNGNINDQLDLIFYSQEPLLKLRLKRGNKIISTSIKKGEYEETGIRLEPLKVSTCSNNCIFCFVNQLPKGLRKPLYIKDEDYRFSFLHGNYVTLCNLTEKDKKRVVTQRLSPLYISVHTTNKELRKVILGNKRAPDIMSELKFLRSHKIKFHTQIVLCPGYNDGKELEKTISDLGKLYPYMLSTAVVPVGLTKHRRKYLRPVDVESAGAALAVIDKYRKRFLKKYGDPLVYGADELYIKADVPFPSIRHYGDLPQIENGVGMVPYFLYRNKFLKLSSYKLSRKKFITFTGASFHPFLSKFIDKVRDKTGVHIDLVPVPNRFFGENITVTGLLTGRDIIKTLSNHSEKADIILVPDVLLKESTDMLLDDTRIRDIEHALGKTVRVIESLPMGLLKGLEKNHEN